MPASRACLGGLQQQELQDGEASHQPGSGPRKVNVRLLEELALSVNLACPAVRKIMDGGYSPLAFLLPLRTFAPFWKIPLDKGEFLFGSGEGE